MKSSKKGFTLIELLIVIGILAVLATVTVLVLNPAQLFAQARDSQRLADLGSVKGAIALYLTTVADPVLGGGTGFTCGTNWGASVAGASSSLSTATANLAHAGVRTVDGEGWVAVNLGAMSGGSPLPALPVDPINATTNNRYYSYGCNDTAKTFELNANMESERYSNGGSDDVEANDGGNNPQFYEIGTEPGLDL
jgi:prepilin-type N-terminal cleavage/methylation domain-containing protein